MSAFWRDIDRNELRLMDDYLRDFPDAAPVIRSEWHAQFPSEDARPASITAVRSVGISTPEERLGHYRLIEELGRGGQAIVYRAEDLNVKGRFVALKVLKLPFGVHVNELLSRFRREAEITAKLDHPSLCRVYEVGVDGVPFIAMRLIEGRTLAQKIALANAQIMDAEIEPDTTASVPRGSDTEARPSAEKPRTVPRRPTSLSRPRRNEIQDILRQIETVARALHVAHEVGIVHRDIKPGNLMVQTDGTPVILDFGLARDTDSIEPSISATGQILGTPAYLAPEQLGSDKKRVDRRTDVWALGVTLFECLTLARPFEATTREGLYRSIVEQSAPDPRRLNAEISIDLAVVLAKAIEKSPDARFQSALEFAEELRRIRQREPIKSRPISTPERHLRWILRNPGWAVAVYASFILLALTSFVFYTSERDIRSIHERETAASASRFLSLGRLAMNRCDWPAALESFESAESSGCRDFEEMARGRVRAHLGLMNLDAARREIAAVRNKLGANKLPPGLKLLATELDPGAPMIRAATDELLREILATNALSPADRKYCEARLETDMTKAKQLLSEALIEDPGHREAQQCLAVVLATLGEVDEIRKLAVAVRARSPNDTFVRVLEGTVEASMGNLESASDALRPLQKVLSAPQFRQIEKEVHSFAVPALLCEYLLKSATGDLSLEDQLEFAKAVLVMDGLRGTADDNLVVSRGWSQMLRATWVDALRVLADSARGQSVTGEFARKLTSAADRLPSAAILAAASLAQPAGGEGAKRSIELAKRAISRPSSGRIATLAAVSEVVAVSILWSGVFRSDPAEGAKLLARIPPAIRRLMAVKSCDLGDAAYRAMIPITTRADAVVEAIRLLDEWVDEGASIDAQLDMAVNALGQVRPTFAIIVAQRIMAKDPENARARTILADAVAKLPSTHE